MLLLLLTLSWRAQRSASSAKAPPPARGVATSLLVPVEKETHAEKTIRPPTPLPEGERASRFEASPRERWLDEWAGRDFATALAWARQQAPDRREWALGRLVLVLAKVDPEAGLYLCEEEGLTMRLPAITATVMQLYAIQAPEAAHDWVQRLPAGALRQMCEPRLFAEAALHAPELAGRLVMQSADGPARAFETWLEISPANAGAWLVTQPELPWRDEALHALMAVWPRRDGAGVEAWLEKLPAGAGKDRALAAFEAARPRADAPDAERRPL